MSLSALSIGPKSIGKTGLLTLIFCGFFFGVYAKQTGIFLQADDPVMEQASLLLSRLNLEQVGLEKVKKSAGNPEKAVNKLFSEWAKMFGRDDFLYLATDGTAGRKPAWLDIPCRN